ncbi:MAG: Vgb family protein [Rubrobacteraceae bacterium]
MTNHLLRRALIMLTLPAVLAILLAGCGGQQNAQDQSATNGKTGKEPAGTSAAGANTAEKKYTPPEKMLPPPEPADSPPLKEKPAGKVIDVGSLPEGLVADPKTGLVAVGLRNPDQLALVDSKTGKLVRKVKLSGSARHLGLLASGGPVLVPAETSDSLVQVSLPEGKIVSETPVDNYPHNVASAPNGRIFVISEARSTASMVENRKVVEKIKVPANPGGGAVTKSGLLGAVGVRGLALGVYKADTLDSLGFLDAGKGPTHVAAGPDDRFYVTDTRGGVVLVYQTRPELKQVARISLPGGSPYGIAVDTQRKHLWVTLTAKNRLIEYDLRDGSPRQVASYPTVRQPNSVTVNPATGRVFVAGRTEGVLQMIDP